MVTIALDAMGGDHFPKSEIEGALQAARDFGIRVILVGQEQIVRKELDRHKGWNQLPLEVHHASEQITMEESAGRAVRTKKDSSIRVAARLVKKGEAHAVVSAGNTGAVMATAKMVCGMLPGVDRPALASAFPTRKSSSAIMLDVGANVDCSARMLTQFAVMGDAYSRIIFKTPNPRVGLLSIGEEAHKGNSLTHDAFPLLKEMKHINFIGNVEGGDIYNGNVDVIVCDGFVGNVALKASEGLVDAIFHALKESLTASLIRKTGTFLARGAFKDLKKLVDYAEYGGAPLLGLNGLCVICHGRSNAKAIRNALRIAKEFTEGGINERIAGELDDLVA